MRQIHKSAELRVSRAEFARMEEAAAVIADCRTRLAASAHNILCEVAPTAGDLVEWRHYPEGEVYDPASHAQYFYHAHSSASRPAHEHGHFHTFLRAEGMPFGVAPLLWPEAAIAAAASPHGAPLKRGTRDEVSHLVAVSLDARGEPIRLFTTNRWVTGETWYPAADVIAMLDRFVIAAALPSRLPDRWLVAVMQLFRPQIAALLQDRDETIMAWRRRRRANVFEDPRLEITSSLDIDLGAQLAFIDRARSEAAAPKGPPAPRLPRMAEGWGETRPEYSSGAVSDQHGGGIADPPEMNGASSRGAEGAVAIWELPPLDGRDRFALLAMTAPFGGDLVLSNAAPASPGGAAAGCSIRDIV